MGWTCVLVLTVTTTPPPIDWSPKLERSLLSIRIVLQSTDDNNKDGDDGASDDDGGGSYDDGDHCDD